MVKVLLLQFAVLIVFPVAPWPRPAACNKKNRKIDVCSYIAKTLTNPQLLFICMKKPFPARQALKIAEKQVMFTDIVHCI